MMQTRMDYVERWARMVCELPDKEWSKMQAEFIDSQIDNAQYIGLTKEQVKYIKEK
jgi:hypothetical protein